jgi:hypothetical protein
MAPQSGPATTAKGSAVVHFLLTFVEPDLLPVSSVAVRGGLPMAGRIQDQHQPEPWSYEGRAILNAAGWTLAKTIFESDARRIVAAVNDVLGIPTPALEAGFIREILVPRPEESSAVSIRFHPLPLAAVDPAEYFIYDRRLAERRRGDRRQAERRRGIEAVPRIVSVGE